MFKRFRDFWDEVRDEMDGGARSPRRKRVAREADEHGYAWDGRGGPRGPYNRGYRDGYRDGHSDGPDDDQFE